MFIYAYFPHKKLVEFSLELALRKHFWKPYVPFGWDVPGGPRRSMCEFSDVFPQQKTLFHHRNFKIIHWKCCSLISNITCFSWITLYYIPNINSTFLFASYSNHSEWLQLHYLNLILQFSQCTRQYDSDILTSTRIVPSVKYNLIQN